MAEAKRIAHEVPRQCELCQAAEQAHHALKTKVEHTLVPSRLMESVAVDIFQLPSVSWEGGVVDCVALCVDRLSGWHTASVHQSKGLTAAKVARAMYFEGWSTFGIPSVVTSDRGPHFAGAWFRTMCGLHGVRQAFSQAYHHAANGRAETAGKQLCNRLRRMHLEKGWNWAECLPAALRIIHDVKGEGGLSPYEVVFGRQRPLGGIPYVPLRRAEEAEEFFARIREQELAVSKNLNDLHAKRAAYENQSRPNPPAFASGDKVWYKRPTAAVHSTSAKLASYCLGPCIVKSRVGQASYEVEVRPGTIQRVHVSQLKPHREDSFGGPPLLVNYFQSSGEEAEDVTPDEWDVESILQHRVRDGKLEFLTKWEGFDTTQATWEGITQFFPRFNEQGDVEHLHWC